MDENSPIKQQSTSKFIDSLHSQIDGLKEELESTKLSSDEHKKKYKLAVQKNESFVDQLANAKHENDMISALLKRKERRISDLEDQYNELSSANESLELNNKNMRIRCENLQESSASSTAEYERLKIAYDALIASQVEYKKHYQKELNSLTSQFEAYKLENTQRYEALSSKLVNNDKDIDTLLDSLTNKKKTMDNLYVTKNKTILELLSKLAKVAKIHGQESKAALQENVEAIVALLAKHPDLQDKITKHEKVDVDLDEILNDTNETLLNCSFDEEATLINSPDLTDPNLSGNSNSNTPQRTGSGPHAPTGPGHQKTSSISRNNTIQGKRRKNKRNSIRFDSKSGADFSTFNTPTTPTQITLPKRPNLPQAPVNNQAQHGFKQNNHNYYEGKPRTPTPPNHSINDPAYDINPAYQFNPYTYNQLNGQTPQNQQQHQVQNPQNQHYNRSYRNSSNGFGNQQHFNNSQGNHQNHQQYNNQGKKYNRRSMYNNNSNNSNNSNGNQNYKRNSQVFEPNNLNLALNT